MSEQENIPPKPIEINTDSNQSGEPASLEISGRDNTSGGLVSIPSPIEKLSNVNPRLLGGLPQAVFLSEIYNNLNNQVNNQKVEIDTLRTENNKLREKNSSQEVDLAILKTRQDSAGGINLAAMVGNVIGMGILGLGFDMYGNEAFGNLPLILLGIGALIFILSWFIGYRFGNLHGIKK